jgi:hypothetical protein
MGLDSLGNINPPKGYGKATKKAQKNHHFLRNACSLENSLSISPT